MSGEENSSRDKRASAPASEGRLSVAPQTRPPYEVYSQPLDDREHAKRELMALVDGTPNFAPHYYAICKSGLAIAVNAGGRNAASDIAFLAHAGNCHHDLLEALKAARDHVAACWDGGDAEYADEIKADLDQIDAAISKAEAR